MANLTPNFYRLNGRRIANWTAAQEKSISQDYPFLLQEESPEDYVARTYLQYLWLPESIMPLHLLVPSLRRVNMPSTSTPDASIHPMHDIIEPILLKTRSLTNKYQVELPQILADGGGAGELEETMMWYSLTHEKGKEGNDRPEEIWTDEEWREGYLERMERREVLIQVLLYFYKLSLPGPRPIVKPSKRKRSSRKREPEESALMPEEYLEAFMDKLSMWQLVSNLDRSVPSGAQKTSDRDWIQSFVEDVVERQFQTQLPELCALLRTKTFPTSLFPDEDDTPGTTTRRASPPRRSTSRMPSPAVSNVSRAATLTQRSRSRSISVSLAQEQAERERASAAPSKKRILNREVSMSRMFKPRPKRSTTAPLAVKTEAPVSLKPEKKDTDIILVEETPQKPRRAPTRIVSNAQPSFSAAVGKLPSVVNLVEENDEEEWMIQSSPDIVLLATPKRGSSSSSGLMDITSDGDDDDDGPLTPCRPTTKRRR